MVRVWVGKGWFGPVVFAATCWVIAAVAELWSIETHIPRAFINVEVILFVMGVPGIVCALRRKATLTTRQVILRGLFGTRRVPLHEIVSVHRHISRRGPTGVIDFLWYLVAPILVDIQTKNDHGFHNYQTGAFGWGAHEAMTMIVRAAQAAGSPFGR